VEELFTSVSLFEEDGFRSDSVFGLNGGSDLRLKGGKTGALISGNTVRDDS
jgi:hypothetical protein